MTLVNRSADCGNSPKNKMAENIAVALEIRDGEFLATILVSDALWNYVGGTLNTAKGVLDHLNKPTSQTIDRVMSHGKVGAVNGIATYGNSAHRFCYVIEFTSAKCNQVCRIESYDG